jgi:tRNA pseudouridine38/39 synthase
VLPDDIQFIAWCPVDKDFSARFDCKNRTYKYFFPKGNLNIEKMNTASKYLIGNHDFRNFCKMDVNNGVTEFFRTISSVEISCYRGEENCSNFF